MDIHKWIQKAYMAYLRRKSWQRIVRSLAVIVVFCTTYALILPAITMESPAVCGFTEHSHMDQCYEQRDPEPCTLPETPGHSHTDSCYQDTQVLSCGLEAVAPHKHGVDCAERIISCTLKETPAHFHSDACRHTDASGSEQLVCGLEETEGHSHTDDCYTVTENIICGLAETPGHDHGDECYTASRVLSCGLEESEGHSHADDSTEPVTVLICTLDEHRHTQDCYPEEETETTEAETLPEGDPTADLETQEDWEASLAAAELTGDPKADVLAIARTQLGYEESRINYIYDENNAVRGYSRYGQWIGNPYGDWNGAFVSFCLHYGGVEEIGPAADAGALLENVVTAQRFGAAGDHMPGAGDLIFLDRDADGTADFAGIVEAVRTGSEEEAEPADADMLQVIAGAAEGRVSRLDISAADPSVLGYGLLPEAQEEQNPETALHIHQAEDGSVTQVRFAGTTEVPQDAKLTVTEILQSDESYQSMAGQIEELLEGRPDMISLLDISFYDRDGEYLKVPDTAQVVMDLDIGDADPKYIRVFHFVDGKPVELKTVNVYQTAAATAALDGEEDAEPQIQTQLMFETEGFSIFAVVEIMALKEQINLTDPADLADRTYYIVSNNRHYVLADVAGGYGQGLGKDSYTGQDTLSGLTAWTFLRTETGTFRIRSDRGLYLVMEDTAENTAKLSLTEDAENATAFTVRPINGQAEISYDGPNGIAHYMNVYGGNQDFCGWKDSGSADAGSKVYLHLAQVSENITTVNNLDGKSYLLINRDIGKAIGTQTATVNGVSGLQSVVVQTSSLGTEYYTGDAPVWTFEDAGTEGTYYVSAEVDGTKKYLRMLDVYYGGDTSVSKGSLTLGDEPQQIRVTENADGTVCLTVVDGSNTGYINLDQSGIGNFWVYNAMAESNKLILAEKLEHALLTYQLDLPNEDANWVHKPAVLDRKQQITDEGVRLQKLLGANKVGTFVYNSITHPKRQNVRDYYASYNDRLGDNLTAENYKAPGAEYQFLWWETTVNGETFRFAENTMAYAEGDSIRMKDMDGVERILPPGTVIHGKWEKICDVVFFFVNFGDTMLEHQNLKPITNTLSAFYTDVVAIGHIYNEKTISDTDGAGHSVMNKDKSEKILGEIVAKYDPTALETQNDHTEPKTQIVIDVVTEYDSTENVFKFVGVSNFNQNQLESAVAQYLRDDPDENKQIKINDVPVDKTDIVAGNYKLYWYVQKKEDTNGSDGWHIDGVLVANTVSLELQKTFSGLTEEEAEKVIERMQFRLGLINTSGVKYDYMTLAANGSEEGVYTNDGKQGNSNIYQWTLQSIRGQRYAFTETDYQVEGHDWSGLVSVHYSDGRVETRYNTDTTFGTADLYDGTLVGGTVESVIFANFYTETGTGAFSISKVEDEAGQKRLQGAEFVLTGITDPSFRVTKVTNGNGSIHFADLRAGTYQLKETKAPDGYQGVDVIWTVTVAQTSDGVTVTVKENGTTEEKLVYDSANGGIRQIYPIRNKPEDTTVTVNKVFSNITQAEVNSLKDYCIEVRDGDGNVKNRLTLANAMAITGTAGGYTWTVDLECDAGYTFVEKNFHHKNYLDAVVAAKHNGSTLKPKMTDTDGDNVADTAIIAVTKSDSADTVDITNTYTNTFTLKICKVDATDSHLPIANVEFNIYGSFGEAVGSESLEYEDANGNRQTAYLIGKTDPTDENGITWYDNMKLSTGSRSFVYVVDEVATPAGYVELDEPIVRVVEVTEENYSNGVYILTVENVKRELATVTVTATKQWNVPDTIERVPVTLTLYRKSSDGRAVAVREVTLDGTDKTGTDTWVTGWTVVWQGLPYAEDTVRYEYYVSETALPGYNISYSSAVSMLQVGTKQVPAAITEGTNLKRSVTVINSTGYKLPDTGGSGTEGLRQAGLLLLLVGVFLYWETGRKRQNQFCKKN